MRRARDPKSQIIKSYSLSPKFLTRDSWAFTMCPRLFKIFSNIPQTSARAQKILSTLLFWVFGLDVLLWAGIYPLVFLVIALFFFPNGVLNGTEFDLKWVRKRLARLRKTQSV